MISIVGINELTLIPIKTFLFMTFINKVILVNIRLFKKRVVHTRFDVFVFLKVETEVIVSITASLKDELRY
jgi:hypothetical protein